MATIRRKMGHLWYWPETLRNKGTATIDFKGLLTHSFGMAENGSFWPKSLP
jgi:hypothetical protein